MREAGSGNIMEELGQHRACTKASTFHKALAPASRHAFDWVKQTLVEYRFGGPIYSNTRMIRPAIFVLGGMPDAHLKQTIKDWLLHVNTVDRHESADIPSMQ